MCTTSMTNPMLNSVMWILLPSFHPSILPSFLHSIHQSFLLSSLPGQNQAAYENGEEPMRSFALSSFRLDVYVAGVKERICASSHSTLRLEVIKGHGRGHNKIIFLRTSDDRENQRVRREEK